jgi:hypothetical protein
MQEAAISSAPGVTRRLGFVLSVLVFIGAGCTTIVPVNKRFPSPVVEPLPVNVGVHYDKAFRSYKYRREGGKWVVPIGPASVALFKRVFAAMFEQAVLVGNPPLSPAGSSDFDAVIEPEVKSYEFLTPVASGSDFYQVSIEYRMRLYDSDGEMIAEWPVTGQGRSHSKLWGADQSLAEATTIAMRDAAAAVIINFRHRPRVENWLSQVNGNEDRDNVGSAHKDPSPG